MRSKVDPKLTQEISHRFVELVENHLRLSWGDLATLLGYSNRTTLHAVKDGRTLPGPDKLYTLARWISPQGTRANIDWLFSAEGDPLIDVNKYVSGKESATSHQDRDFEDVDIGQLPPECKVALAHFVRALRQTNRTY